MNQIKIVSVDNGEYEWLYFEDVLEAEGHSIDKDMLLNLISSHHYSIDGSYSKYEVSEEFVACFGGSLPNDFSEIPLNELVK